MELQVHQRSEIAEVGNAQILQLVLSAKLFTGIFEIEGVRAVPHHPHRIDLAEADIQ